MASVEPWRWTLCDQCASAGRTKPARRSGCRCRITAWRARWRSPEGKTRGKVFARKRDADVHVATVESAKATGAYVDPGRGRQRFADFARVWAEGQDWKDTTRESWPYIEARLDPLMGKAQLAAVDQLMLKRVRAALAKEYARATVKLTMAYAGMIMRAAYTSGRIGRDPTVGLRAPKARAGDPTGQVGPEDVPTRAEALAILAGAPSEFRAAVALGLAGLRVGEVLGLTADRIELDARRVRVDRQMQRIGNESRLTTPKAEKVRAIIVPGLVAVELRRHLRDHASEGILFRGLRGAPMLRRDQFYASGWRPALKKAGLAEDRFVFHACRHWCASTLLAEGAPLTAVAGHLGDTVETVSRTYVHWLRDDREIPAQVLDRMLSPVSRLRHEGSAAGE
jgi:integrase